MSYSPQNWASFSSKVQKFFSPAAAAALLKNFTATFFDEFHFDPLL